MLPSPIDALPKLRAGAVGGGVDAGVPDTLVGAGGVTVGVVAGAGVSPLGAEAAGAVPAIGTRGVATGVGMGSSPYFRR